MTEKSAFSIPGRCCGVCNHDMLGEVSSWPVADRRDPAQTRCSGTALPWRNEWPRANGRSENPRLAGLGTDGTVLSSDSLPESGQ